MKRICGLMIGAGLLASVGSASAATLSSWTLDYNAATRSNCGLVADCKMVFTSSTGAKIAVYAYSTNTLNAALPSPNNTIAGVAQGTFTAASLTNQSTSGLGIRNAMPLDTNETTSPEHAADNETYYDAFVFEALSGTPSKFDWESIGIGWAREYARTSTGGQTNTSSSADIQFFVGDKSNKAGGGTDFSALCLTGCTTASNNISDASSGFKTIGHLDNQSGTVAVPGTSAQSTGRYMVVSGALNLGGSSALFDAFKLKSVTGYVPEPSALALLGLGAFVMFGFGRQRRQA